MRYYFDKQQLRYDYVVQPGADLKNIQFTFAGAYDFYIAENGDLAFTTRFGEVKQTGLFVYQWINGCKIPVEASFTITSKQHISFRVGTYNTQYPLIIDPLIYSTFLGGSSDDYGYSIEIDASENAYITGYTRSTNYPVIVGSYQTTYGGSNWDAFVTKLNSTGSTLVYSTFLGGSSKDLGYAIAIDVLGNTYITGGTESTNYPITAGAYQTTNGGGFYDAFVTKLNSTGSTLVYSTFLGGNYSDEGRSVEVDASGNAYVTGRASSTNYPVTAGAYQTIHGGGTYDAFVTKLNPIGSTLVYSTFLGGNYPDEGYSIVIDTSGNAYVTGRASSTNYPVTAGAYQTTHGGFYDAFVTKLNPTGSTLVYSTFLGKINDEIGYSIAIDFLGNAYITGLTSSTNYPVTAGAYQTIYGGGTYDAFVTKLNPIGSTLVYSTFLGGDDWDFGYGIEIDFLGNAYITGLTSSTNYPVTAGAYQTSYGFPSVYDINDAYVTKLNSTGSALVYSTYLGGNNDEFGRSIAIDASGNAYITGKTASANYPVTAGAYQTTIVSTWDAFVTKLDFCLSTYDTLTVTTCNSYTSPSGNYTWNTSGVYNDTLVNAAGCDSIVTVNLTINVITNNTTASICQGDSILLGGAYQTAAGTYQDTIPNGAANGCDSIIVTTLMVNSVDTSVTNNSPTLTANASGATYQWLDCNNGFAPIVGETGQSFTATVNGDYAVAVTQNACTDTSACFAVTNIGIVENDFGSLLKLYPNPTKGEFIVDLGENYQYVLVTVTDLIGRTIMRSTYAHSQLINLELNEAEGIYFLKIDADGKKAVIRIVKE